MFCRAIVVSALVAFSFVQAAPATLKKPSTPTSCSISAAHLYLPAGQTAISVPAGQTLSYVALGVGIQNYTCSATRTYASVGAVATLYDIPCLIGKPGFANVQDIAYAMTTSPSTAALAAAIGAKAPALGHHFFVTNPTGAGVSPFFEIDSTNGFNPPLSILAQKAGSVGSPSSTRNVDWLELTNVQGALAKTVFRVDTKGGQPPATCTAGSKEVLSVKYAAKYWFFK